MRLLFTIVVLLFGGGVQMGTAQSSPVYLPKVSSQYLTQVKDGSARLLVIGYMDDQAYIQTEDGRAPFTQLSILAALADPDQKPEAPLPIVRLEAEQSLPLHYWQDVYFWLQLAGYTELHVTVLEMMDPSQKQYIAVPIVPFFYPKQAYAHDAERRGAQAVTPLQHAQKVHPDTDHLSSVQDPALRLRLLRSTPLAYVPQQTLSVELKANGNIVFQGQASDPVVLSTLIQSALATHYKNTYEAARPQTRLWLDVQVDGKATVQHYAELLMALSEAYHLYWEELSYNKYQKTYLELSLQEQVAIKEAAPLLLLEYDPAFKAYWKEQLKGDQLRRWQTQP